MIKTPRGVIEVKGVRADFDISRPGGWFADRWRSEDPLLEAEIRRVARPIDCPHPFLGVGATMHIIKVAHKMGGRVIAMIDCDPLPDDLSDSWLDHM